MRQVSIIISLLLISLNHAQASTNWTDLQRQNTELTLRLFESASLSMQVLNESTIAVDAKGTVVVFPDQQQHALSPGLLNTLRQTLPAAGWHLFIMPAPELPNTENVEQRIEQQKNQFIARWQLLNQQGNLPAPVIVIAQGETAAMLNLLVADATLTASPAAIVNLGAYLTDHKLNRQLLTQQVAMTPLPLLDLITALDHPHAKHTLEQRQLAARLQQNPLYRQRYLSEAYRDQSMQQWLIKEILGWLRTNGF